MPCPTDAAECKLANGKPVLKFWIWAAIKSGLIPFNLIRGGKIVVCYDNEDNSYSAEAKENLINHLKTEKETLFSEWFEHTKVEDWDPEKFASDSNNYNYPHAKTILLGVNISF